MPTDPLLISAISIIPPGRYAVAVSGGADSVALLHLLKHHRPDLHLHVVHLDHQTRGPESTGDAQFVRQLAEQWQLPHTIELREKIEPALADHPQNPSALYRAVRHELFRRVVAEHGLDAVLLAHHADDQAETILHRLLRGSGPAGLAGMQRESRIGELKLLRPLLGVPGLILRQYLREMNQPWREDASNASDKYFRNRLRQVLRSSPELHPALLDLGSACGRLRDWIYDQSPRLGQRIPLTELRSLPPILAAESARRWLIEQGCPPDEITPAVIDQLLTMALDAVSPPRQHFPGQVLVRRKSGMIFTA